MHFSLFGFDDIAVKSSVNEDILTNIWKKNAKHINCNSSKNTYKICICNNHALQNKLLKKCVALHCINVYIARWISFRFEWNCDRISMGESIIIRWLIRNSLLTDWLADWLRGRAVMTSVGGGSRSGCSDCVHRCVYIGSFQPDFATHLFVTFVVQWYFSLRFCYYCHWICNVIMYCRSYAFAIVRAQLHAAATWMARTKSCIYNQKSFHSL